jgi:hypothetical protein
LEWGVNHGYLDKAAYSDVIEKAWKYLSTVALQTDGSVGYVQPIGEKPDPTKIVDAHSQAPFGTGAWLLAACERVRYVDGTASLETRPGAPRIAQNSKSFSFTVKNSTDDNRNDVIELEAATVFKKLGISGGRQFLVLDGDKVEVPYQITTDGKVLIQVFVRPQTSSSFTVITGEPKVYRLDCNGRIYPNREDDLTWENDRNAWRFYGPKMHNKGVTGFDIFCKNISAPVQDDLYHNELTSYGVNESLKEQGRSGEWNQIHRDVYTYHRDKGLGMDAYTVGGTLGAGAPALLEGDKLLLPDVYEKATIVENGPLRFTVNEQMYAQDKGTDKDVVESRLISQDRGSHMARCTVEYTGLSSNREVAAGIVVHESAPSSYIINKEGGYVAYADALDTPQGQNGELYIAVLFPENDADLQYIALQKTKAGGIGHVLGKKTYSPGTPLTYYFGTAWSKYDVPTLSVWQTILNGYTARLHHPLEVVME